MNTTTTMQRVLSTKAWMSFKSYKNFLVHE